MGAENIVERIMDDARREAEEIIAQAEEKAAKTLAEANERCERAMKGARAEVEARVKAILDGKAATARLDSAKCELAEKRRAVDAVYAEAYKKLNNLEKPAALALAERLLKDYAEKGDEIVFSADYKYKADVAKLSVVAERGLKLSDKGASYGGFVLKGESADKDVSYTALLSADREENISIVANGLFITG